MVGSRDYPKNNAKSDEHLHQPRKKNLKFRARRRYRRVRNRGAFWRKPNIGRQLGERCPALPPLLDVTCPQNSGVLPVPPSPGPPPRARRELHLTTGYLPVAPHGGT